MLFGFMLEAAYDLGFRVRLGTASALRRQNKGCVVIRYIFIQLLQELLQSEQYPRFRVSNHDYAIFFPRAS